MTTQASLPILGAPAPSAVRVPRRLDMQQRVVAKGARPDLAALVKGDRVTVYADAYPHDTPTRAAARGARVWRPVGFRVVRGLVRGGTWVSVHSLAHPGNAEHYSTTDGTVRLRTSGASIRPWREGDGQRIDAWDRIVRAEAVDKVWLNHAAALEAALTMAQAEADRLTKALPAARTEARIAAAALVDARARLAAIEEGGT